MNKIFTYDQYQKFYKAKGFFPDKAYSSPKGYNDKQLRTKYDRYVKAQENLQKKSESNMNKHKKINIKKDIEWERVRAEVYKRDNFRCRLFDCLNQEESQMFLDKIGKSWLNILNPAHVFKVGSNPALKYKKEFIVTLNQMSHGLLDSGKHPITGIAISPEETEQWWIRVVGEKKYMELKKVICQK